ncbi:hypothetical protein ACLFKT_13835, partial [Paraburkholderia sp. BR14261]
MHLAAPQSPARCVTADAPRIAARLMGQAWRLTFTLAQRLQKGMRKTGHTHRAARKTTKRPRATAHDSLTDKRHKNETSQSV